MSLYTGLQFDESKPLGIACMIENIKSNASIIFLLL